MTYENKQPGIYHPDITEALGNTEPRVRSRDTGIGSEVFNDYQGVSDAANIGEHAGQLSRDEAMKLKDEMTAFHERVATLDEYPAPGAETTAEDAAQAAEVKKAQEEVQRALTSGSDEKKTELPAQSSAEPHESDITRILG